MTTLLTAAACRTADDVHDAFRELDTSTTPSLSSVAPVAEELGYRLIDRGSQSRVFAHPKDDRILKIAIRDRAYAAFVRFVADHPDSPYLPKIHANTGYDNGVRLYLIEPLMRAPIPVAFESFILWETQAYLAWPRREAAQRFSAENPCLAETFRTVAAAKPKDVTMDVLSYGNILYRGFDTLVISDPWLAGRALSLD